MAERLIDAEALMYELDEQVYMQVDDFSIIANVVRSAPTIEAKPVVHAYWDQIANGFMVCSHCEEIVEENRKYSFCPLCGAQMDEIVSDTNVGSKTDHIAEGGKKEPICGDAQKGE